MQGIPVFLYLYFCLLSNTCDFQSVWRVLPVCPCTPADYKMHDFLLPDLCLLPFLCSYLAPVCSNIQTQFSSVAQSCPTLCDPMNCSMLGFPVHHKLPELTQTHVIKSWCHPTISSLLLPPSIFPSIRVFSNESVLRLRWPKCWTFSFRISPSNEYSGLISFRMDWLDLLAV